jgi:hypothetical protein
MCRVLVVLIFWNAVVGAHLFLLLFLLLFIL